jgi:ATP phosphoribosyltransferase regulatory subunit HisZ
MSFIELMKDKTRLKYKGNVLHRADEGQNKAEIQGKCPS